MRARSTCLAVLALLHAGAAAAQDYPVKAVTMLVPYSAGSTTDIVARALVDASQGAFGKPFVVINRDGAAGTIAMAELARAAPDGYTILFGPQGILTLQLHLRRDLSYKFEQVQPICQVADSYFVLGVGEKSPFATFNDLLAEARKRTDKKLNYGVPGIGAIPHLQMHMLATAAKFEANPVAYRNYAQVPLDLVSGVLDFAIITPGSTYGQPIRFLALLADKRSRLMPNVPTTGEFGLPASAAGFFGLYAPAGTPAAALAAIEKACAEATKSEAFRTLIERTGSELAYLPRAAFTKRLEQDFKDKAEAAKAVGMKTN
jgi:tripartite-type tricarboxylate transporter receptor subunit TctC